MCSSRQLPAKAALISSADAWQRRSRCRSECRRIALARYNAANDAHPCRTRDVGHDMVQLDIHLHQGLLHVLNVGGGDLDESFTMTKYRANCADGLLRAKRSAQ